MLDIGHGDTRLRAEETQSGGLFINVVFGAQGMAITLDPDEADDLADKIKAAIPSLRDKKQKADTAAAERAEREAARTMEAITTSEQREAQEVQQALVEREALKAELLAEIRAELAADKVGG